MAKDKQSKTLKRGVIIHQILHAHGFKFSKHEDNFDFYSQELADNSYLVEVFGFNSESENAIITFFGIEAKMPISCDCEIKRLEKAIAGGYKLQTFFNNLLSSAVLKGGLE